MESSNPQGTSLTVGQAADAFLGLMGGGEPPPEQVQDQPEEQEVAASESEYEEAAEEVQEEEPRFTVKAAGEEREVTLSELIEGYQKGTDYHKKTNALAEQRKAVEAERIAVEQAKQARDAYSQRLQAMDSFLNAQIKSEDIEALKETDPIAYVVKVAEQSRMEKQINQIRAERERIAYQQQAEREARLEAHIAEEAKKLNVPMVIVTNGRFLDEAFLNRYKELGHILVISVDSVDREKWNEFRGRKNFDIVMPKTESMPRPRVATPRLVSRPRVRR